jgi:two-component system response regulator YesN
LVTGKSRIVVSGEDANPPGTASSLSFDKNLAYYIKENKSRKIKDLLCELLEFHEKAGTPQFLAEEDARSFLDQVRRGWAEESAASLEDNIEYLVDDAFYYATDYGDLEKNLLYILEKMLPEKEQGINKIDTPEFFGLIEEFVKNKLAEPLSLQQCCIHVGISQTYMSRLFRKYTGLSFNNYLTRSRIEKAKQYLSGGSTLIKEAATLTGFSDQFYFSKVFKSLTGLSPSEFISGNRQC